MQLTFDSWTIVLKYLVQSDFFNLMLSSKHLNEIIRDYSSYGPTLLKKWDESHKQLLLANTLTFEHDLIDGFFIVELGILVYIDRFRIMKVYVQSHKGCKRMFELGLGNLKSSDLGKLRRYWDKDKRCLYLMHFDVSVLVLDFSNLASIRRILKYFYLESQNDYRISYIYEKNSPRYKKCYLDDRNFEKINQSQMNGFPMTIKLHFDFQVHSHWWIFGDYFFVVCSSKGTQEINQTLIINFATLETFTFPKLDNFFDYLKENAYCHFWNPTDATFNLIFFDSPNVHFKLKFDQSKFSFLSRNDTVVDMMAFCPFSRQPISFTQEIKEINIDEWWKKAKRRFIQLEQIKKCQNTYLKIILLDKYQLKLNHEGWRIYEPDIIIPHVLYYDSRPNETWLKLNHWESSCKINLIVHKEYMVYQANSNDRYYLIFAEDFFKLPTLFQMSKVYLID